MISFSDPDPESGRIFQMSGPMINNLEAFFFFKLEEKTGLFFICYNFFPEYTLYSHIYHNLLKPV